MLTTRGLEPVLCCLNELGSTSDSEKGRADVMNHGANGYFRKPSEYDEYLKLPNGADIPSEACCRVPSVSLRCSSAAPAVSCQPRCAEWFAEWCAELWYVRRSGDRHTTSFCLGAFRDALWLRRNRPPDAPPAPWLESPVRCLGLLALVASACVLLAIRHHPPDKWLPVRGPVFAMLYMAMLARLRCRHSPPCG